MFKNLLQAIFPRAIGLAGTGSTQLATSSPEFNGATINPGALLSLLQYLITNTNAVIPVNGQTLGAGAVTLSNLTNLRQRLTNGGAVTVTLDNAYNVVNNIPAPYLGLSWQFEIMTNAGTTVATPTVTNTGITLAGVTTVTTGGYRVYGATITQLYTTAVNPLTAGTTFTSLAQIGSTNTYTLTLGTNAITTTVGNLIYIGTTAGTLPAGWYPCYSAGTTSIVIAAPAGTVWTCTAASMVQPTVVPSTYAPLISISGIYGMSAGVMVN